MMKRFLCLNVRHPRHPHLAGGGGSLLLAFRRNRRRPCKQPLNAITVDKSNTIVFPLTMELLKPLSSPIAGKDH